MKSTQAALHELADGLIDHLGMDGARDFARDNQWDGVERQIEERAQSDSASDSAATTRPGSSSAMAGNNGRDKHSA